MHDVDYLNIACKGNHMYIIKCILLCCILSPPSALPMLSCVVFYSELVTLWGNGASVEQARG